MNTILIIDNSNPKRNRSQELYQLPAKKRAFKASIAVNNINEIKFACSGTKVDEKQKNLDELMCIEKKNTNNN